MCRHLHVPLQAGDDNVLKRMRRKYTTDEFRRKIEQLHEALPDVAITTDVIVGFPGETEEMFENGYRFIEEMKFAELHVFPYSKRSGTPAARMEDQVDEEVKNRRVHQLIELSNKLALAYSGKFVGDVLEVIPEEPYKEAPESGLYVGHSDNYLKLIFQANESLVGKICKVRVDEPGSEYCKGTFVRVLSEEALKA
jgi:threonylcarbamoyladenosine tRNA methylthiotransferase MtaB